MPPTPPAVSAPPAGRLRPLFAVSATVVLVGLLAALFVGLSAHSGNPTSPGSSSGGPIHRVGSDGDSRYIASAVTARGVDNTFHAVDPTQHFNVNDTVYVILRIQGIATDERHTISIRWLLNANNANTVIDSPGRVTWTITGPSNLYFALNYPVAGNGIANVYWDTTHDQIGAPSTDARLAATLKFTIGPAVDTPTPTPTPTPPPPTPTATSGPLPITIINVDTHQTADNGWAATANIQTQPNSRVAGTFSTACDTTVWGSAPFEDNTTDSTGHATMLNPNGGWDPSTCPGTMTVNIVLTGSDPHGNRLAGSATCTMPTSGEETCHQDR